MNILKKIYRKITNKLNILTIIIGCFTVFFGVSYSFFVITTSNYRAADMYMGKLIYSLNYEFLTKDGNGLTLGYIAEDGYILAPGEHTIKVFVSVGSLNTIKSRYKLQYKFETSCPSCQVLISDATGWNEYGNLKPDGSNFDTKKIKIVIINPNQADAKVTIGVTGGYAYKSYENIAIASGFSSFGTSRFVDSSDDIYLNTIASENLECIPTASEPCMYGGESTRNYVNYNGTVYRILGLYGTSSSSYVKMIQASNVATQTTYANSATALTSYFNGLPSSKTAFFTGTTASLISTTEYGAIGYEDSYVNNGTETLTSTVNSTNINYIQSNGILATKAQTANSYIKPILTLKPDAYINYGDTGSSANPYEISDKVDLIITKITIGEVISRATPTTGTYTLNATCTNGTAEWENATYSLKVTMAGVPTVCKLAFTSV